jgi:hypothetical protein
MANDKYRIYYIDLAGKVYTFETLYSNLFNKSEIV